MNAATAESDDAEARKPTRAARRRGRELGIALLYAWDRKNHQDDGLLLPEEWRAGGEEVSDFGHELYAGVVSERPAVDAVVDGFLTNWSLARLAVVDRAILRLGCYELLYRTDTPPKVAINEYIELAKQFGSDHKTAKLVNGVLDRIAREHRSDEVGAKQ